MDKPVDLAGTSFWTDHVTSYRGLVLFMIHRVLEGEMSSLAQTDPDRGLGPFVDQQHAVLKKLLGFYHLQLSIE